MMKIRFLENSGILQPQQISVGFVFVGGIQVLVMCAAHRSRDDHP
jgi:hypothetical protein